MILSVNNIYKTFSEEHVLENVSFHMNEYDKTALIGRNGTGKSTLLKIIVGELQADSGTVTTGKDTTIGYLSQHQDLDSGRSIYEEVLSMKAAIIEMEARLRTLEEEMKHLSGEELEATYREYHRITHAYEMENGYAYRSEVVGVLKGLGFEESMFDKQVSTLSGGQKTRVALAKLLLSSPDLILLDEPTNHLDLASIAWLETFLMNYKGSVLIVSHDRYFLNRIANRVVELEHGHAQMFLGNYDQFAEKKAQLRETQRRQYENQQREIRHQEEVIERLRSFNREKSIKRAESRVKMLDKMERIEAPASEQRSMSLQLTPCVLSGNDVLTVEHLSKSFGTQNLFRDLSFLIRRGEKVAILGENGTGKTTLLKIIRGIHTADTGSIRPGAKVEIGYYDQEQQNLCEDKTIFEELQDTYPNMDNTQVRSTLAAFLFTGDDVFKKIESLSGGERGRVSLAKLMLSESNFLLLDEPTNHLDIDSKEILEDALRAYTGTVLYVSHDRYFVNRTATRILDLTRGTLLSYDGNYDDYLEMKERKEAVAFGTSSASVTSTPVKETEAKANWKEQKEAQAKQRKLQNQIAGLETDIERYEARIAEIDEEMARPEICTNSLELNRLATEQSELEEKLLDAMTRWEELQE